MTLFRNVFRQPAPTQRVTGAEAWRLVREQNAVLLDVRGPAEYASGHPDGAINIALQDLPRRIRELPDDRPIVVYCASGRRSASAGELLAKAGYTVYDAIGVDAVMR